MSCLKPYEPLNVLKPLAENVWIVDGPVIDMTYVIGSLPFTTRMTVVRLADGGLWLHSPTPLTPELAAAIDALGPVRALVAPNKIHFWWLPEWRERYPEARVTAAPRVLERAKERLGHVDAELQPGAPSPWGEELQTVLLRGAYMDEAEFFHAPSGTLILTDLIENFEPDRVTCGHLKLLLKLGGVADPHGGTAIDLRMTYLGRRPHLRAVARTLLDWRPRRVVFAHGRCYLDNAEAELHRALRWML